jgi:hypothetical protein
MRAGFPATLIVALVCATPGWAQSDFSQVKIEPGDRVHVTHPSGVEVSGILTDITSSELNVAGHLFKPIPGLKIDRAGDSIWTGGTLIGVAAGAVLGVALGDCYRDRAECVVAAASAYGGIGALIDYFHEGRTTVFRGRAAPGGAAAHVVPLITRHQKGLAVSFAF